MEKIEFYPNIGRRCAQTVIKSVVGGSSLSLNELDEITGRKTSQITHPIQVAYGLLKLGAEFIYPVKPYFLNFSAEDLQEAIKRQFGEENSRRSNMDFVSFAREEIEKGQDYSLVKSFSVEDLANYIDKGRAVIALIDYDLFVGREDKKRGHYLIVHSKEGDKLVVMDPGPCDASPNKTISLRRLEDSLMQTPIDYGAIII